MEHKLHTEDKLSAMRDVVISTANQITMALQALPKSKHHRNVFIKTYNRRPGNKKKRARALCDVLMAALSGAAQVSLIQARPAPRMLKPVASMLAEIGEPVRDMLLARDSISSICKAFDYPQHLIFSPINNTHMSIEPETTTVETVETETTTVEKPTETTTTTVEKPAE